VEFESGPPQQPPAPLFAAAASEPVFDEPEPEPVFDEPTSVPPPHSVAPEPVAVDESPAGELASPTLGELYFSQGHTARAIEVYEQVLEREPHNERARTRLRELRGAATASAPQAPPHVVSPAPSLAGPETPQDPAERRRAAIRRTIGRLEGMLAAVRRG
jgi:hypothetical protein